jgi:hypothetical protein
MSKINKVHAINRFKKMAEWAIRKLFEEDEDLRLCDFELIDALKEVCKNMESKREFEDKFEPF